MSGHDAPPVKNYCSDYDTMFVAEGVEWMVRTNETELGGYIQVDRVRNDVDGRKYTCEDGFFCSGEEAYNIAKDAGHDEYDSWDEKRIFDCLDSSGVLEGCCDLPLLMWAQCSLTA